MKKANKKKEYTPEEVRNIYRRNILRVGIFGAIAFVLGKIFGPRISLFSKSGELVLNETNFKNFRYVETNKEMTLFDKFGNSIVTFEKD